MSEPVTLIRARAIWDAFAPRHAVRTVERRLDASDVFTLCNAVDSLRDMLADAEADNPALLSRNFTMGSGHGGKPFTGDEILQVVRNVLTTGLEHGQ